MISYGTIFSSCATSLCRRPMKRLMEKIGVLRVGDLLMLGRLPDEPLALLGEGDDGRA